MSNYQGVLERFCPVVYLHRKESVRPIQVEEFIAHSTQSDGLWHYYGPINAPAASVDDVPFYGKVDELVDGSLSLLYMFMYAYNAPYKILGCFSAGAHIADLEHVRVHVDEVREHVLDVAFGQHSNQIAVPASEVLFHTPTRPVVYSARGSHASYPTAGIKLRWNTALFACDSCNKGWCWNETACVSPWPSDLLNNADKLGASTDNAPRQWWWSR